MRLGVLSDLHFRERPGPPASWHGPYDFAGVSARVRVAVARFREESVDAIVALGDFTHDGDEASLAQALAVLTAHGDDVYVVAGNHDLPEDEDRFAAVARAAGVKVVGARGVTVRSTTLLGVCLRRDRATAGTGSPEPKRPVTGFFAAEPLEHAPDGVGLTVVLSHFPLVSHQRVMAEHGLAHPGDLEDRARLAAALDDQSTAVVVLSGHLHVRDSATDGGVLQLLMPAIVEAPMEATIVDLDLGRHELTRTAVTLTTAGPEGPVLTPATQTWRFDGPQWRLVTPRNTAAA
jgi:predicted phosphodiesterase